MNAVYALWIRQLKRFVRSRVRIFATLGQPILYLVAFGYGFGALFQQAGQGNYIQFLAPGIMAMTLMFSGVFSGIELIWDRQFGFLKETLVAPVPRRQIMVGRTVGGATVSLIQALMVVAVCYIAGFRAAGPRELFLAVLFMWLIAIMFTAMGNALAAIIQDFQAFQLVMNFLVMPMFFLSGALFPLRIVPAALKAVAAVDPFAYGVDGLRTLLNGGTSHFGLTVDLMAVGGIAFVLLGIGGRVFARMEA